MSSLVMWFQRPIRFGVLVVVGLALIAAAFAAGLGISRTFAIPVANVNACVNVATGEMRYVYSPTQCNTPYEYAVSWNGQNPADFNVNFYRVTSGNVAGNIAGRNLQHTLACNSPDDTAVSGGFFLRNDWNVIKSQQNPADPSEWQYHAQAIDVPTARNTTFAQFQIVCAGGLSTP